MGFLRFARGSCGSGSLLSGPISRPRDLSPELLWGRAYKRSGAFPLLAEAETVEALMQLHLPVVVGRLLANHMPLILLHAQWYNRIGLLRWWCICSLLCIPLGLPRVAIFLDESSGDRRQDYLARDDRYPIELAEARDQGRKSQGPIGPLRVQRVPSGRHPCKQINGVSNYLGHMNSHPFTRLPIAVRAKSWPGMRNSWAMASSSKPEAWSLLWLNSHRWSSSMISGWPRNWLRASAPK